MQWIAIITAMATLASFLMGGKRNYEYSALGKPHKVIEEDGTTIVVSTRRWSETAVCFASVSSVTATIRLFPVVGISGILFLFAFVFVTLIVTGCFLMSERVTKFLMEVTARLQKSEYPIQYRK